MRTEARMRRPIAELPRSASAETTSALRLGIRGTASRSARLHLSRRLASTRGERRRKAHLSPSGAMLDSEPTVLRKAMQSGPAISDQAIAPEREGFLSNVAVGRWDPRGFVRKRGGGFPHRSPSCPSLNTWIWQDGSFGTQEASAAQLWLLHVHRPAVS